MFGCRFTEMLAIYLLLLVLLASRHPVLRSKINFLDGEGGKYFTLYLAKFQWDS